jgi:hypothetical protein
MKAAFDPEKWDHGLDTLQGVCAVLLHWLDGGRCSQKIVVMRCLCTGERTASRRGPRDLLALPPSFHGDPMKFPLRNTETFGKF